MRTILCLLFSIFLLQYTFSQTISPSGPVGICPGGSISLNASNPSSVTISWEYSVTPAGPWSPIATGLTYNASAVGYYRILSAPGPVYYDTLHITANAVPTASFSSSPSGQCGTVPVQFTNASTGTGLSYSWDFGDPASGVNNTSTATNPGHFFAGTPGNSIQSFSVSLTVTNNAGCTATSTVTVSTIQLPDGSLGGPSPTVYNGKNYFRKCTTASSAQFDFTNLSTTSATNTSYQIIWGDASPDYTSLTFAMPASHTYTVGTHTLLFIVTGQNGCVDTTTYYVFLGSNPAVGLGNPGNTAICTSNTLTFPISSTASNTPGTVYTVAFNDGTASQIFTHPAPADISHTFLVTSCNTNSPLYPNSFSATIQASNPCASSSATVVPIYVSEKDTSAFTISPNDTVCVNNNVTLTNTTGSNNNVDNGECTPGKIVWVISPTTGFTISSGNLGNDFGLIDPSLWQAGSDVLLLNFSTPGTYIIKLKTGNLTCGLDSIIKTICVNPIPSGGFTLNRNTGCAPLTVNTTTNSNTPFCGTNSYQWTINYSPTAGCSPAASSFNYLGGTSNTSAQPIFQFNNPGIYTVDLLIIGPASSCSTQLASQQISVKGDPIVNLNPITTNICQGQSITPVASASCYIDALSTYTWTFPGGVPSTSNNPDPGTVVFNTTGQQTISLSVTNLCGTSAATTPATIIPTPTSISPPNIFRCAGASIGPLNFTGTTTGATISWTNSNTSIGLAASGTGSTIPAFTATNGGLTAITAIITATTSLNGCSSAAIFTITVNPTPLAPAVNSPVNYCQNIAATPLTAAAGAGNTLLWYNVATGGTGSVTNPTPVTTTSGTFPFYVSQVIPATGCEGPRSLITVNVNPSPNISGNSQVNPNTCGSSTGSIILSGLGNSISYIVSYTLNSIPQSPLTITSTAGGTVVIPNLASGIYNNIIASSFGCPSNSIGPLTLSDPSTPATPSVGSNSPLCAGNALSLTSSTTSTGTVTYAWTGPNGFINATQNPTIPGATIAAGGTYFVTVKINNCVSQPGSVTVVINPTPATPTIGSNSPVCTGNSINLNSSIVFAGPVTYAWTGPNSFTSTQQNPTIPIVAISNGGNYFLTITATTGACPSAQASTIVTVKPTPNIATAVPANPTQCGSANGIITLSGLIPSQSYIVNYTFNTAPVTTTLSSSASGNLIITGLVAGTYDNINVVLNGCPSNSAGPFTLSDPNPPATPVAGNNGPVCSGGTLNLTSTAGPAGTIYNWSGPAGFTSNSQNPIITNVPVTASGTYTLTIAVNACNSASITTTVAVNETPATPAANNNGPVCTGNSLNLFSLTTFAGPVTYTWTGPNSFTSNSQTPVVPNVTAAAAGTYTVLVTSATGNCASASTNTVVVVNATPNINGSSSANPINCASATGSITLNGMVAGSSYTVTYTKDGGTPVTLTLTASVSGQLVITGLTAGTYSNIFVSILGCNSNIIGSIILTDPNPPATPSAGSNSSICLEETLNLTATSSASGTIAYSWTGPNGFISSLQNPTIPGTTSAAAGMYFINVQVNNCTSLNDSVLVVINPLGLAPVATSPVSYCKDVVAIPLTATANPSNTLNWYNVSVGGSPLPAAPTPVTTVAGTTNYYVSQTTALGCEGPRTTIVTNINPDAKAIFAPTDTIGCPQFELTPAIINLQLFPANNSIYEWYANGIFIGAGAAFPGYTILNENEVVNIKLKAISLFGCKSDSMSRNFYTYNLPHPIFTKSDTAGCGPLIIQFQNTTPNISQFNYLWDFGNGITSTLEQPGPVTFQSSPTNNDIVYTIRLKVFSICDTLVYSDSVRVKSKPRALFTPSRTTGCSPMRVLFTNTSGGNNNTYYWDFNDGSTFVTNSNDTFTHIFYTGTINTFYVKLVAVNECGSDSITYAIIASPNNIHLNLSFNGTDAFGCAPHTVAFINNTIGAGSFDWNFGDGNTIVTVDNIDTVYHTFMTSGIYSVIVMAQNDCTDTTVVRSITVYPKPVAAFIASRYNACIGEPIQFTNQSDSANAYLWQFGDGGTSALTSPVHTYNSPGIYSVKLISYRNNPNGSSCTDTISRVVQVTSSLPGSVTLSDTTGTCVPFTVTFINHDRPSITAIWDFGDGNTASGDSVVHTYFLTGIFNVTLSVTAPGGCTFNSTKTVTISGPSGTLQYNPGFVCYPDPLRLEAVAANTSMLVWNFGDGNTLTTTQAVVYHNYTNPGTYNPSVTLQSALCNFPIQGLDTIKVDKIDAGFTWTEQQHCGYSNIIFNDTSNVFFGESSVNWDFGDGNFGTGHSVSHQYLASGTYNIMMVVTGNSGCTDTVRKQINLHINNIPTAAIIADNTRCANETVNFISNIVSADPLNMINWTLSNGATGNGASFSHLFNQSGIYTLQLIAGTVNSCFDTTFHTITINPIPNVTSNADLTLCLGNSAQLQATGPSPLQWTPIQGLSCTDCANPIATPAITTPYIVSATNNFGCLGFDTTVITVIQPLQLSVSPDDSICIGKSANLLASGATSYQWSPSTGLNNTRISNPIANPVITTRYRVVGYDGYNCFTDTAYILVAIGQIPTVNLGPDQTLSTGTIYPLTPVITNGPMAQWLWEPATNLSCSDCNIPIAEIKKDITYKVTVTTEYGCVASDVINIKVFCLDAQVFIPNAFTPNNDGKNDILMVRGKGIVTVKYFRIFNRWGEIVFERNNFPPNNPTYGWDGKINGKFSPPGVFVYTAQVICENGTPYEYKGNTTIIK